MKKKSIVIAFITVSVILAGSFIYKNNRESDSSALNESIYSRGTDERMDFFNKNIKNNKIIKTAEEDLTDNGKKDLIVVYEKTSDQNEMVVVVEGEEGLYTTSPIKAPKESVEIKFKNIDNKGVMEMIVSGSKNGKVGYAIYRLEDKKLIDLFGEGMRDCC